MHTEIGKLMDQLCSTNSDAMASCDLTSSTVQQLHAPVDINLYNDLQTLAAMYRKDANCIAGDLLTIALREAFASMSQDQIDHLKDVRLKNEQLSAQKHMEEQRFDAGCT